MAGAITSLMGGAALWHRLKSQRRCQDLMPASGIENDSTTGSFPGYSMNAVPTLEEVVAMHLEASRNLTRTQPRTSLVRWQRGKVPRTDALQSATANGSGMPSSQSSRQREP